jgi:hypothetical protein
MGTRDRIGFVALPAGVRAAVAAEIGPVARVQPVDSGLNSGVAAVLRGRDMTVFVKGLPTDHPRIAAQHREVMIARHVAGIGPDLHWRIETEGWNLLGFEYVAGHHADLAPGSPDLPKLADTLTRLGSLAVPDRAFALIKERWAGFANDADLALLAGDRLLHTDLNPHNVLVTDRAARLVDWAWPTLGAAWIDPACAALWLIAEGHTAADAETWASRIPSWRDAPAAGIDTFVRVNARLWTQIADDDPCPWKHRLRDAARGWEAHRSALR